MDFGDILNLDYETTPTSNGTISSFDRLNLEVDSWSVPTMTTVNFSACEGFISDSTGTSNDAANKKQSECDLLDKTDNESHNYEIKELLYRCAKSLNRPESQMDVYVNILVNDNWIDTCESLQTLSDKEIQDMGIPKGLILEIRKALYREQKPASNNPRGKMNLLSVTPHTDKSYSLLSDDVTRRGLVKEKVESLDVDHAKTKIDHLIPETAETKTSNPNNLLQFVDLACTISGLSSETAHEICNSLKQFLIEDIEQLKRINPDKWHLLRLPEPFVNTAKKLILNMPNSTLIDGGLENRNDGPQENRRGSQNIMRQKRDSDDMDLAIKFSCSKGGLNEDNIKNILINQAGMNSIDDLLSAENNFLCYLLSVPMEFVNELKDDCRRLNKKQTLQPISSREPDTLLESGRQTFSNFGNLYNNRISPQSSLRPINIKPWSLTPLPVCALAPPSNEPVIDTSIADFLKRIAHKIGRSEDEINRYLKILVEDNWFDNIDSLRTVTEDAWKQMNIPKRLVEEIVLGLDDPDTLNLNKVCYAVPDNKLFPSDIPAAVKKLANELPASKAQDVFRSLLKLIESILANPYDYSKRRIKKKNPIFLSRVLPFKSGLLLLESLGYIDTSEVFLLPVVYISRMMDAHCEIAKAATVAQDPKTTGQGFVNMLGIKL